MRPTRYSLPTIVMLREDCPPKARPVVPADSGEPLPHSHRRPVPRVIRMLEKADAQQAHSSPAAA